MHRRGAFVPAPCARPRQKKTRAIIFLLLPYYLLRTPQRRSAGLFFICTKSRTFFLQVATNVLRDVLVRVAVAVLENSPSCGQIGNPLFDNGIEIDLVEFRNNVRIEHNRLKRLIIIW